MVIAMGMFACQEQMLQAAEEYRIDLNTKYLEMYEEAKTKLSPHMLRELQFFFGYDFFHKALDFAFYESIAASRQPLTAELWIDRLKETEAAETVANMVFGVYVDKMEELLDGAEWEQVRENMGLLIERVKLISPQREVSDARGPLLECMEHPEETKHRYLGLISRFYRDVFVHWSEWIREESERALARYETSFGADPERFLENFKCERGLFQHPATFHISFVSQVANHHIWPVNRGVNHFWVLFGAYNDRVYGPAADREKAELFFKALSDKRRMEFILLLRERPRYGGEIAAELGITPAAVIYHANFFFFLNLVEFKRKDHRLYYHLNAEKLRELLEISSRVLLHD